MPAFTSRIAPGTVWVDGRLIEYALCQPSGDVLRIVTPGVFPPGDGRALIAIAPFADDVPAEVAQTFVDVSVYRRLVSAVRGIDEAAVEVPERVASWPLGMTEEDVAKHNADARAIAEQLAGDGTTSLTEYRRSRQVPRLAKPPRSRRSS